MKFSRPKFLFQLVVGLLAVLPLVAQADPKVSAEFNPLPPEGKAYICLFRLSWGALDPNIRIDEVPWAKLSTNSLAVFEVAPGTHFVVADDVTSRGANNIIGSRQKVSVKAGEVYFLESTIDTAPGASFLSAADFYVREKKYFDERKIKLKFSGAFTTAENEEGKQAYVSTELNQIQFLNRMPIDDRSLVEKNDAVAVIIGNHGYSKTNKDLPDVDYAANDAEAIYRYVTQVLGFRKENIILLKDATQSQMLSVFGASNRPQGKLFKWVKPQKSDVFVYYSGHGIPGVTDGRSYLLPVDADPTTVELNGYPLDTLYSNLGQLPAKSLTVVIDACFSGSSAGGAVFQKASSITLRLIDPSTLVPTGAILTATGDNQVASWDTKARMGLFTRAFLEGVSGAADHEGYGNSDGRVSLGELTNYLREVVAFTARKVYGREQNPQIFGDREQVVATVSH